MIRLHELILYFNKKVDCQYAVKNAFTILKTYARDAYKHEVEINDIVDLKKILIFRIT